MKKNTMTALVNYINDNAIEALYEARDEMVAELGKNAEKAAANRDLYEQAREVVMAELGETPVTISELFDAVEGALPDGFTKGKLQYAVTRMWTDAIVRIEGKVNTYRKA